MTGFCFPRCYAPVREGCRYIEVATERDAGDGGHVRLSWARLGVPLYAPVFVAGGQYKIFMAYVIKSTH